MNKMNVLAFGVVKDIFGNSSAEVEFDDGLSVGDLKSMLEIRYPQLKKLSSVMIAVNDEYANHDDAIKNGDEVAIIPPVSGG